MIGTNPLEREGKDEQLKNTGRIAFACLAIVTALSMTACGSDDKKSDANSTKATTSVKAPAADKLPPTPTAADLNTLLSHALDPNVPNTEKREMVQGAENDPDLPSRLAEAYTQTGAKVEVTEVAAPVGDTLNAKAKLTVNGQENIADVPFVAENGRWKVQKQWACQTLSLANIQSSACAS
ncbi:hypothetical protein [Nocardia sp. NBC_00403]|uniref:hypothetical protein n=1 Tax=Nocardia sp. NBC_00403 TaxID=2975990 RepID=UPI002E1AB395